MTGIPVILEFDLASGSNIDAVVAARALIAWSEAIKEAANIVDPSGGFSIDLVSAEPACLRFSTILNFAEQKVLGKVSDALDPYPKLKQFLALNVLVLPGVVIGGLIVADFDSDDPETADKQQRVSDSPVVQKHVQTFYKEVQSDPAITRVVVRERSDGPAVIIVERNEFAERSGLWAIESDDDEPNERLGGGIWNVVVTHPVSIGKPLSWGFMRDGLPFRAKMVDPNFLAEIRSGTLPITIQEGVVMEVRVSYSERLEGQLWLPVTGTYKIEEVLSPRP